MNEFIHHIELEKTIPKLNAKETNNLIGAEINKLIGQTTKVIVLEGFMFLNEKEITDLLDIIIFLQAPLSLLDKRRKDRGFYILIFRLMG